MIKSHQGWDIHAPSGRGGGRHAQEIGELWAALANCQAIFARKCTPQPTPTPVPVPVPVPAPAPASESSGFWKKAGYVVAGTVIVAGIVYLIVISGGTVLLVAA